MICKQAICMNGSKGEGERYTPRLELSVYSRISVAGCGVKNNFGAEITHFKPG